MTLDPTPAARSGAGPVCGQRPRQAQNAQRIWRRATAITGDLDEQRALVLLDHALGFMCVELPQGGR